MSSRPGSHRFSPDELNCFRRICTPSGACEAKSEVYFQTTGQARKAATDQGLAALPVLKGKFYKLPGVRELATPFMVSEKPRRRHLPGVLNERLPEEELTSAILNEIYPRSATKELAAAAAPAPAAPAATLLVPSAAVAALSSTAPSAAATTATVAAAASSLASTPKGEGRTGALTRDRMAATTGSLVERRVGATTLRGLKAMNRQSSVGVPMVAPDAATQASTTAGGAIPATVPKTSCFKATSGPGVILELRHKMLDRYSSINEACDSLSAEVNPSRAITRKEWRRVLRKQGFAWSNQDVDLTFKELDARDTGGIMISDFHIAMEAAAPVRCLEDLRRRWLASGFGSMTQAIKTILEEKGLTVHMRMCFEDFAFHLTRVSVLHHSEHQALFAAVCSDRVNARVSISELQAAIATVSPCLLMEEVRQRLQKSFHGNFEKAYNELDLDKGGTIENREFCYNACRRFGFTDVEAKKVFRQIDVDNDGEISKAEFVSAMALCGPALPLEDLRLKVRRCFRSIQDAFHKAFADKLTGEIETTAKLNLAKFQDLLLPLDLTASETRTLFEMIDINKEGEMTAREFVIGVHHFVPSCALEDLRVRCMQRCNHVADVFASVADTSRLIGYEEFADLLKSLELINEAEARPPAKRDLGALEHTVHVHNIFDLLDVTNMGSVTVGRLVAALQSCGPGARQRPSPQERDVYAMRELREELWSKHRYINELKMQVRLGVHYDEARPITYPHRDREDSTEDPRRGGDLSPPGSRRSISPSEAGRRPIRSKDPTTPPGTAGPGGARPQSVASGPRSPTAAGQPDTPLDTRRPGQTQLPPKLRTVPHEDLAMYMDDASYSALRSGPDPKRPTQMVAHSTQSCWGTMWNTLTKTPAPNPTSRKKLQASLQEYFQSATLSMSHDVPLISGVAQSPMEQHRKMRAHKAALQACMSRPHLAGPSRGIAG